MGTTWDEFSEFLDTVSTYIRNNKNQVTIVGGDFNMDERFTGWLKGLGLLAKRMKKEFFELGYIEALSHRFGQKAFTFRTNTNKKSYQLDYLFIPGNVKINKVSVPDEGKIFKQRPRLSDHLPIIAHIEL